MLRSSIGLLFRCAAIPAAVALSISIASPQTGPIVWTAPSLQRVAPHDSPGVETQAQLWAARGEYESFQIITRAPDGSGLTNLNVSVSDLTGPGGEIIAKTNVSLYREYYVYIGPRNGSPKWYGSNRPLGAGWYPDALIPLVNPTTGTSAVGSPLTAVPYDLSAGNNQPIWVDVYVPRSTESGRYSGTYSVTSNQGNFAGNITLNVWHFALPLQPSLISSFGVWNSDKNAIYEELLRNRIMPDSVPIYKQASLASNYGLNATGLGFWGGASYGKCKMSLPPTISAIQSAAAAQEGTLFVYDYSADEIDKCANLFPIVRQWAQNLHRAGVKNLVTMGPVRQLLDDGSGTGRSAVDIWAVLPDTYNKDMRNVQCALRKGDQVWSYNAEVQDSYSPKWEIDFAPINFRIQPGFINQSLNMTGLLYWRVDRWSSSPWTDVTLHDGGGRFPGDGELLYPGSTIGIPGVVPSMRLKWLRDGVDDYDYIQLLKEAGRGDWAIRVARSVGPDWIHWTRNPNLLEAARLKLGRMLDDLGNKQTSSN